MAWFKVMVVMGFYTDMEIVAGTAGMPAEPYDRMWGTQKVTAQRSMTEYFEVALFELPLDVRLPLNVRLPHETAFNLYTSYQ